VLVGAALALVGLAFAALTAAAVQVFQGVRAAYGIVTLALGAAFVLRAVGDIGDGTLSWLSPIGWGQRTFPYSDNRWWPLLLPLAATALHALAAFALLNRRDFAAGLIPPREGREGASRALGTPIGLAWRLQRGALVAWTAGTLLLGVAYGSVGNSMEDYVRDNPEIAEVFGGGDRIVDSYLGFTFLFSALIAAAYGLVSTMRLRAEETSGRAEPIFATRIGRLSWLTGHLTVPLAGSLLLLLAGGLGEGLSYGLTVDDPAGQTTRMLGVALVYVPATWLIIALTVLGLGWLPRAAAIVAWAGFAYCTFIAFFGDTANLPGWIRNASPFAHTPQVPLDAFTAPPLIIIAAVVTTFMAAGYAGVHRRDLGY
jgi:ABC-2 type transport system permease protein